MRSATNDWYLSRHENYLLLRWRVFIWLCLSFSNNFVWVWIRISQFAICYWNYSIGLQIPWRFILNLSAFLIIFRVIVGSYSCCIASSAMIWQKKASKISWQTHCMFKVTNEKKMNWKKIVTFSACDVIYAVYCFISLHSFYLCNLLIPGSLLRCSFIRNQIQDVAISISIW